MLSFEDAPTIRNAILKRLDTEPGVKICDIKIIPHRDEKPPYIAVGVQATISGDTLETRSVFHLPAPFELRHLHNEVDEMAEQFKTALREYWLHGRPETMPQRALSGTGMRGRWRYG